ncbi:arginyltransferase [Halotalea alkalilenta]|uniref:arginyltransferase n=1 Tax=Halotalea alkalilenta TaxID=376489 RepID=UPI000A50FD8C|nr:arginyltransferase [Halotalea alkalilenta]
MSFDASPLLTRQLRFFLTVPHPCSYLPGQEATTLFLDPNTPVDLATYSALTQLGFRRSGQHLYRPHCAHCRACVSVRIPVQRFTPDRSQRRIIKRNQDLSIREVPARYSESYYALYAAYIDARHADGDMYPPTREQFRSFLTSQSHFARMVEFRLDSELLAVAVVDRLPDGLSAIYTFYSPDPSLGARSLGSYAILWQIRRALERRLPYVYLGYWIEQSAKMRYKQRYRPLEYLQGQQWRTLPLE